MDDSKQGSVQVSTLYRCMHDEAPILAGLLSVLHNALILRSAAVVIPVVLQLGVYQHSLFPKNGHG